MAKLRYPPELSNTLGNESTLEEFVAGFSDFDELKATDQIELLDDLYRPDMGISEVGAVMLPELIRVTQFFEGRSRLNLFTCIASIQHGFFEDQYGGDYLTKESESLTRSSLTETRDELQSLVVHSHTDVWRSGLEHFLLELQEVIESLPYNACR